MNLIFQIRTFLFDERRTEADRLRRAGYRDGEPQPKYRRHWANR